jgi:hypothetical protein
MLLSKVRPNRRLTTAHMRATAEISYHHMLELIRRASFLELAKLLGKIPRRRRWTLHTLLSIMVPREGLSQNYTKPLVIFV